MPLSDNEQRLLEQMERALYAEDPKFASTMRGAARPGSMPRMAIGIAGLTGGLVVLVLGVASAEVVVGVIGFVLMLAGTAYALSSRKRTGPTGVVTGSGGVRRTAKSRAGKGSFMQRIEQRWDRRRDER